MSRILNIGAGLLFVCGAISMFFGIYSIFSPSSVMLSNEDLLGMTVVEIYDLNPNMVEYMVRYHQLYGLFLFSFALFLCIITLIPYRRREKWAWYATLVIGGVALPGTLLLARKMVAVRLNLLLIILWIVGLLLPIKEIHGKPIHVRGE
jgi:hypothetical protein